MHISPPRYLHIYMYSSQNVKQFQEVRVICWKKVLNNYYPCILNTGKPTYRHPSHHFFSVPDISVCNPVHALEFVWQTHGDRCGSDHFPVIPKTSPKDGEPFAEHWKFDKADWLSSALYVCRNCLMGWSCLRIQWLSLLIF